MSPACVWEVIHGFQSLSEYKKFVHYIEGQILNNHVVEVEIDPDYGLNEIYGGRWFKDIDTGRTWRLIAPDYPFRGLWEPVVL